MGLERLCLLYTSFLVFIDRLMKQAREGTLPRKLQLIYISPLKSLAGDIRENLRRPLDGISGGGTDLIDVAIRTGDTPQRDRPVSYTHLSHTDSSCRKPKRNV